MDHFPCSGSWNNLRVMVVGVLEHDMIPTIGVSQCLKFTEEKASTSSSNTSSILGPSRHRKSRHSSTILLLSTPPSSPSSSYARTCNVDSPPARAGFPKDNYSTEFLQHLHKRPMQPREYLFIPTHLHQPTTSQTRAHPPAASDADATTALATNPRSEVG